MRLCEKNQQKPKYVKILMNNRNIMFGLSLPYGKFGKSKIGKWYVLMNVGNVFFRGPLST